jgi:hypothetical protein
MGAPARIISGLNFLKESKDSNTHSGGLLSRPACATVKEAAGAVIELRKKKQWPMRSGTTHRPGMEHSSHDAYT